jgi:hypothetical protein
MNTQYLHHVNIEYFQSVLNYFNEFVLPRVFSAKLLLNGRVGKFYIIFPTGWDKFMSETRLSFHYHFIIVKDGEDIEIEIDYSDDFHAKLIEQILEG